MLFYTSLKLLAYSTISIMESYNYKGYVMVPNKGAKRTVFVFIWISFQDLVHAREHSLGALNTLSVALIIWPVQGFNTT